MNVTVRHIDGVRFEADARGHKVVCDQPAAYHGTDRGMTPPEFLLASLGTCAAYYAAEYLRTRHLPTEGLTVEVDAEKAKAPSRIGSFAIHVLAPAVEDRHMLGLERAVKSCLIHNTLLHAPEIRIVVDAPAVAN